MHGIGIINRSTEDIIFISNETRRDYYCCKTLKVSLGFIWYVPTSGFLHFCLQMMKSLLRRVRSHAQIHKVFKSVPLLCMLFAYTVLLLWIFYPREEPSNTSFTTVTATPPSIALFLSLTELNKSDPPLVNVKTKFDNPTESPRIKEFSLENIRNNHLFPYNLDAPTNYSAVRPSIKSYQKKWKQIMAKAIVKRLDFQRNGFFVECGALDGLFLSNTLLLERTYNWTGLLVEADPDLVPVLKSRNRHAWVADVCLAPEPHPMKIEMVGHKDPFYGHGFIPNNVIERERLTRWGSMYPRKFRVQCYPLDDLMAAINRTEIDYFSLDVEGVELDILKTIPFDKIHIKLIGVEVRPSNKKKIHKFLRSVGYKRIMQLKSDADHIHDDLYEFST